MMLIRTVGELKDFIKDLPDDTPLLSYQSDMEKQGYQAKAGVRLENMVSEEKETYDAFDYTPYSYTAFFPLGMIAAHFVWSLINLVCKKTHPTKQQGVSYFYAIQSVNS